MPAAAVAALERCLFAPEKGQGEWTRLNCVYVCVCVEYNKHVNWTLDVLLPLSGSRPFVAHFVMRHKSPSELCTACVCVCATCVLYGKQKQTEMRYSCDQTLPEVSRAAKKQQQLATLDSLSSLCSLFGCSQARTVPNDANAYYQKRKVSRTALPSTPPPCLSNCWSAVEMELKMFWRVTTHGNGMQKFYTWVAFPLGWEKGAGQGNPHECCAGSSVAFCFVALPRNTCSHSLYLPCGILSAQRA